MLRIAICDDDRSFISYLEEEIRNIVPQDVKLDFYESGSDSEFIGELYHHYEPDILFLNVEMPETDGYTLALKFRRKYPSAVLIFCSESQFPEPKLLKVNPYRYLVKQYPDSQFENELEEIFAHLLHIKKYPSIWGSWEKTKYKLTPDDILYISIAKRGCVIHLFPRSIFFPISKEMSSHARLQDLYNRLYKYKFVYAHNSYIVNLKYVVKYSKAEIQMEGGNILTISRSRKKEFDDQFDKFHKDNHLI